MATIRDNSRLPVKSTITKEKENVSGQTFDVRATQKYPNVIGHIREGATKLDMDMAEFVRQAIRAAHKRVEAGLPLEGDKDWTDVETGSFRAPYLSRIPCGPWNQAVDTEQSFTISADVADEFEAQKGDAFVRAEGASMEGAGIEDNFLVLVRPYRTRAPRRGDIVLVQVFTGEGEEAIMATMKRFDRWVDNMPLLLDGNDQRFELPEGTIRADLVARAVGIIGSI